MFSHVKIKKNMEKRKMMNKILEYIFEHIPKKQFFSFIIGTNHISDKMIGYEKGKIIKINKEYPSFKIITEFFYRALISGFLIYWVNNAYIRNLAVKFWESLLQDTELLSMSLIIIAVLEFYLFDVYLSCTLKKRLHEVGFDKRKGQQLPQYFILLKLFQLVVFIPIFLSAMVYEKMWLLYFPFLAVMLLYINFTLEKIEKKNIILFYSKVDYDDAVDSVDIEKEIAIILKTSEKIPVNLLNTNIYIKNNDDILLLFKNHETKIIERNDILYIEVKDYQIRYVNHKWADGDIIHYSK